MQAKNPAAGIIMMIIILIISMIFLGISIDIIHRFHQYGDIFRPECNLSIFNIFISIYGIIISAFGLIIILTNQANLNKIVAFGYLLLGLCAFISLMTTLMINSFAIKYTSSRFLNNMNHYRDNPDARNIVDIIQIEYDCCGDNIWLDWSRVPLNGITASTRPQATLTTIGMNDIHLETNSELEFESRPRSDHHFRSRPHAYQQFESRIHYSNENKDANIREFKNYKKTSVKDPASVDINNGMGLYASSVLRSLEQAIRRKRQIQSNSDNEYNLPLSNIIVLPQSCCTNDVSPTSNLYCIYNSSNIPKSFRTDGCSKKISQVAVDRTLIIAVVNIILLVFGLITVPIVNQIYLIYIRRPRIYGNTSLKGEHDTSDEKSNTSAAVHSIGYKMFHYINKD